MAEVGWLCRGCAMRYAWWCLVLSSVLAGCAAPPGAVQTPSLLFADDMFAAPTERINAQEVFALSAEMRTFLHTDMASTLRGRGSLQALADALYRKSGLQLEYDAALTRNAAQAFAARAGNCLSLVVMTAAFAKELGLRITYQSALHEEVWSRADHLYLLSGHINIALSRGPDLGRTLGDGVMIDFLPPAQLRGLRTQEIGEPTVLAMFMNNRAAEALVQGRVDDAYWWARTALMHDAGFAPALNTLGVIYKQRQHTVLAQHVLEHAVALRPNHAPALANLISLLRSTGQAQQADALAARLAQLEPVAPFHFFHLGQAAMQAGDYAAARDFFTREVRRAGYNHEFHFWLAQAYFKLGQLRAAHQHLTLAMQNSTTRSNADLYAAKLAHLRQLQAQ
jgi:Tfp pilus assembly protein PilF